MIAATGAASLLGTIATKQAHAANTRDRTQSKSHQTVQFIGDGMSRTPNEYAMLLHGLTAGKDDVRDSYGQGGAVAALEKKFAAITGKEKAIYMPTGTMANQLAASALSGDRSKVLVQDLSHYYRDEADAAQLVHGRRLVPVKENSANFTLDDVKSAISAYRAKEYFKTGVGAIVIENPVRRSHEEVFDINAIKSIAAFARANNIGMHLDGARLYMASAYSGVSIKEYSQYFDTVYISLYKYLGAGSGAILCGPTDIIDAMPNQIKIYGGNTAQSWSDAVVALNTLDGFEERFAKAKARADRLFTALNAAGGIRVDAFARGSNVFKLSIQDANPDAFQDALSAQNIRIRNHDKAGGFFPLKVNETILNADHASLSAIFTQAYQVARI